MNKKHTAAILGAGTMGRVIATALRAHKIVGVIRLFDQGSRIPKFLESDVIFLCVKPQDADAMMMQWRGKIFASCIVISIMAGVKIRSIQHGLRIKKVVRAMPNTPTLVGAGMTVWKASGLVTKNERGVCQKLFRAFGEEMEVTSERMIDVATAVSGSGPAYVFHFAENLIHAARGLGLSQQSAQLLVAQTILGAALLMKKSGDDPATLRTRVTSKKGTTAAALGILQQTNFKKIYSRALRAAYARARELFV